MEVLIYVVFFAFVRIFSNNIFLSGLVAVAAAAAMGLGGDHPVVQCLTLFYAGGVLAMASPVIRRHRNVTSTFFLVVIFMLVGWHFINKNPDFEIQPKYFLMTFTLLCVYLMAEYFKSPNWSHPAIEAAGNMTYSSYLLHFPIQLCIVLIYREMGAAVPYRQVWFLLAFIAGTLFASRYAFSLFEKPLQNFIRKRLAIDSRIKLVQAEDAAI